MKNLIPLLVFLLLLANPSFAQSFLNGNFENNQAGIDQINLSNASFNAMMPDCRGFGNDGNLDIITSHSYCNAQAQNGNWYIGMTGGSTDMMSLKTDAPLTAGQTYTISFYGRYCMALPSAVCIGISSSDTVFGDTVYTSPTLDTS